MTKHYAVIGDPIAHSLSPVMHSAGFSERGFDADYSARHVTADQLGEFVEKARRELSGFNVTVPHKNSIMPFLDEISEGAALCGSVNTVTVSGGRLKGESTDGYGLETALKESFGTNVNDNSFCFLGCGGAARAASFHFAASCPERIFFINRTVSKAEELAAEITKAFPMVRTAVCSLGDESAVKDFLAESAVLIQCTSLGLKPDDPPPIRPELIPDGICFYDTIYKNTVLIKYASEHGIRYADGRSMLLHQGARAFSIWTGLPAPVEVMRKALYGAMDSRDK
ncbi:MAG: shikimate dehydrogenase [Lentisphaerae bacterium GWF2_45_14]|nr:MAG: shikimate dehydrogenase [Lentisphaerae bacterium GWF2_45_14]